MLMHTVVDTVKAFDEADDFEYHELQIPYMFDHDSDVHITPTIEKHEESVFCHCAPRILPIEAGCDRVIVHNAKNQSC